MKKIIYIAISIFAVFYLNSCSDKSQDNFNEDMNKLFDFE